MCTLLIGFQVLGPKTLLVAANRDEDPRRPSDPPRRLSETPRLAGGRDRVAGGTWLAIRERRAVVALLNRRPNPDRTPRSAASRSRGLLALEVASVPAPPSDDLSTAALSRLREALAAEDYAPFSLAFLSPEDSWVFLHDRSSAPRVVSIGLGWHVITHADLDDLGEPRTARLLGELKGWQPDSLDEAGRGLVERLSEHGTSGAGAPRDERAVCVHHGPMVTVSSSLVFLGEGTASYRHAEGRPCEQPMQDFSRLLDPASSAVSRG